MPFCLGRKLVVDGMSRPGLGCAAECCDPAAARPRVDVDGGGTFEKNQRSARILDIFPMIVPASAVRVSDCHNAVTTRGWKFLPMGLKM